MDAKTIEKITRKVTAQFPEMKSVRPSVRPQGARRNGKSQYLLLYKGSVEVPGGRRMRRVVRVVADSEGRVLRMSTSR
jgi:hypothetical protein